jgi:hypothetical protein
MASITLKDINDTLKSNHEESKEENRLAREDLAKFLADMQKKMAEKSRKDQTDATTARLKDLENRRESVQSKGLIGNTLSGAGDAGAGIGAGIGDIFKGIGLAGAGIGAFFLGLAGAEAIMSRFGDGENLKNLLTNLAEGLGAFGAPAILALGGLFVGAALFGKVAGVGGAFKGGFGIAAIGAGIAAFLTEMSVADTIISKFGDGSSLAVLLKNIGDGIGSLTAVSAAGLGGLFAAGGLFGAVVSPITTGKATIGIAAIGAGISLFFTALAAGDMAISEMGATGTFIGNFATTIADVIDKFSAISGGALAGLFVSGAIFGAVAGPVAAGKATIGIAAIGAGIAAFFTALAAGDMAIGAMEATGANLKTLVGNVVDSIALFTPEAAAVIGGLIAVGGIFGPAMIGATVGIGAIGGAIGLFFAGIGAGDAMITAMGNLTGGAPGAGFRDLLFNTVEGIKKFAELKDLPDLGGLGASLAGLSAGLLAFFGTQGLASLQGVTTEVLASIGSVFDGLFGTDTKGEFKKGIMTRLIEGLEPLKTLDSSIIQQMNTLGSAINGLVDSFTNLANLDAGDPEAGLIKMLKGVAAILAVKDNLINGDVYDGIGWGNAQDIDFGKGLKNFTEDDMATISAGVSKLYAAMNVPTPIQGSQLRAGAGNDRLGGGAGGDRFNYNSQSTQTTTNQSVVNYGNAGHNPYDGNRANSNYGYGISGYGIR